MENNKTRKWHYAFFILIMTGITLGFARGGLMNSGGLFLPAVSSGLDINMGVLTLYFSISSVVLMIALPLLGKLIGKINIKTLVITSVIIQGAMFACLGFLSNVWGFYLLSIPMAIGSTIPCQILGPVIVNTWFKNKTGLAMGVMMAISGGISAGIQPAITSMIVNLGWRNAYFITGIAGAVIVVVLSLLFIRLPGRKGALPYGVQQVADQGQQNVQATQQAHIGESISAKAAKKSLPLYALIMFMLLLTAIASFSQLIATFTVANGFDIGFGGTATSIQMIGALVGALFFGILSDKIGAKISALIALSFGVLAFVMLLIAPGNTAIVIISMVCFGFMTSSLGTLGPLLVSDIFGRKHYASIYSMVAMGLAVGSMIGTPLFGFIYSSTGSFVPVIIVVLGMIGACAGMIFLAFAFKHHMWKKENHIVAEQKQQTVVLTPEMAE